MGSFQVGRVKADSNPPTFQELVEAGNINEASFGTDTAHHYYRNGTWQTEDWIYVKVNVTDVDGVDTVMAEWKNETQWQNYTMTHEGGTDYYYKNITSQPRYDGYSFNIWANDTVGNMAKIYNWTFHDYESDWGSKEDYRKYVGLNANVTDDFSYEQYYFHDKRYEYGDEHCNDRAFPHEQAIEGTAVDTGILLFSQPTSNQETYCNSFLGISIDETYEMNSTTIDNIYIHVWWGSNFQFDGNRSEMGYEKERDEQMAFDFDQSYYAYYNSTVTNVTLSGYGFHQSTYYLEAKYWHIDDVTFSDNDINLFTFKIKDLSDTPSVITTSNYSSFIILNLPDNDTLQSLDTDSDGLNDYQELYTYYTDPKDSDTDDGGENDQSEVNATRDPLDPGDDAPSAVGGVSVPINKIELLAPWIGFASFSTVSTIVVSVVYVKRRKRQQT